MGFHSQIINMVVVDSVLVSAKRLKRNTFAGRNKINEYGIIKEKRIVKNISNEEKLNLVFTKENGSYSGTDSIRYPYKVIKEELNIKCRFYDLRGSYATKILNNGIEIRDVADLLGHRNIETTENFYISSTNLSKRKAIKVFDSITNSDTINKIINYE